MNEFPELPPSSRSWRDIPQEVKPRAMSREGRRRYVLGGLKTAVLVVVAAGTVAGTVALAQTWRTNPAFFSSAVGQEPLRSLVLETDGRLTDAWLRSTLALPAKITLMEVDLEALRVRLLQHRQIRAAEVAKVLPASLAIRLRERAPVARLAGAGREPLLVGRDGVVFRGEGFDPDSVAALPWLTGVERTPAGDLPDALAGMEQVADLLAAARDLTPQLVGTWEALDVARLGSDGVIEVNATDIPRIVFSTQYDFSDQLAWLDAVRDRAPAPLQTVIVGYGPRVVAEPVASKVTRAAGNPVVPAAVRLPPAAVRAPILQLKFDH